jgi:pimeloyl-ACP methyl ester carboxylesterase
MAVAVQERGSVAPETERLARLQWPLVALAVTTGVALAVLVALDGSPLWQVARVLAVAAITTGVVAAQLRLPRQRGALLAAMLGMPALAIAIGFGPHVAKSGPLTVRAGASVLAFAGLGLIIGGPFVATHGRTLTQRVASWVGAVAGAAVVAFIVAPAVVATNVPRPHISATPSVVGLPYEDVSLHTSDGVRLAAWYVPSTNRAAVVLLHGAGSTRSNVLDQAAVLARGGFGVLMVDARGHGDSGGRAMDFGWLGDEDVAAATAFLTSRSDVDRDRIGVVGLSMGGEEALGASGANDLIRAVVAEGATARIAADEAWLSDEYGLRGFLQEQLEHVQDWVTEVLTTASPPTSGRAAVAASGDTRYLLITAGEVADEGHAAAYVAEGAPDRVQIWTVPAADHTGGLDTAPHEWADRVTSFLSGVLLAP